MAKPNTHRLGEVLENGNIVGIGSGSPEFLTGIISNRNETRKEKGLPVGDYVIEERTEVAFPPGWL